MKRRATLLVAFLVLGWIAADATREQGHATTLQDLVTPINVTITDERIMVEADLVRDEFVRGSIGDFRVVNESSEPRNFVVGVESTDVLAPGDTARLEFFFTRRESLPYRVTVNRGPGHTGSVRVF